MALGLVPQGYLWVSFWARIQFAAVLALSMGIGALGYGVLRNQLEATTLEQERARKLAVDAQLASLESHVRPHFLFNTLNTISSLIPEDPKRAETLVGKLAAVLRLSLDSNQARLGSLERELKIIGDYLEIERARYGERLRFRIDVPPELRPVEVPALSLQTLVENSVKHAVGSRFEGAEIRVAAFERGGSVFVQVSDDGPGFTEKAILPGHGLHNLQQRLVTLFGPGARLEIQGSGTVSFCVPRR
jgi:LytS/YehU family sensor histidine kinase